MIVLVGALRVFQDETGSTFSHTWSFAPYIFTALVGVAIIGLAVLATVSGTFTPAISGEEGLEAS